MADEPQEQSATDAVADRISKKVHEDLLNKLDDRLAGLEVEYKGLFERAVGNAIIEERAKLEAKATELVNKLVEKDTTAANNVNSINAAKGAADQTVIQINEISTQTKTAHDAVNQHKSTVESLATRASDLETKIQTLEDTVMVAGRDVEMLMAEWGHKYEDLFGKVEKLLPGATGAGLASGFLQEKEAYETKHTNAKKVFVICLGVLVLTIAFTPIQSLFMKELLPPPTDAVSFLQRTLWNLPLVIPAIWGAWWFNRRASLYDQLAEEYRQKEAISKAFQGYTNQLKEFGQDKVLSEYLANALREICLSPGRIFDKKQQPGSPWEANADKIKETLEEITKKKPEGS